jgi:imidazolonepropionase-like amidohydrolase
VVDGTGAAPARADVVVANGRILDVGIGLDGDEVVDCTERAVVPGLFDCHVHFLFDPEVLMNAVAQMQRPFSLAFYRAAQNMRRTLDAGITTARDAAGADLGVKVAQQTGLIRGPWTQISITMISQTGGHADSWMPCGTLAPSVLAEHPGRPAGIVDGMDEMRRKVRELVRAGADVIKVATSGGVISPRDDPRHAHFRDDELAVLVAEATAAHRFVMAHAQAAEGIKAALRAGIRSIEHGVYLDDEAIDLMLERGAYLVPTLLAPRGVLEAVERGLAVSPAAIEKTNLVVDVHRRSIERAIAAGVKIAMGTDSGVAPHGQNLRELELLADCGMASLQVIVAASKTAAELMGVDRDRGTIEPGKRADLVLVDGDPLDFRGLRERVRGVYQDGVRVSDGAASGDASDR